MSTFEVIASENEQERQAATRAVIAAQTRAKDSFGTFVANAQTDEEREARIALVASDLDSILSDVSEEYGYDNIDQLRNAATVALGGGHASDCTCGFCENKGSFGKDKDKDDKDDDKDDDDDDYKKEDDSESESESDDKKPSEKSSRTASVSPRVIAEYDWDGLTKTADGFSFCECGCDGCDSSNHCESEKCISTKHSGNPGNPDSAKSSEKTAADVETGDTFAQERESLPSSKDGLGDTGAVPTDRSKSGDNLGWDLKPIDVPSNQHPTEKQQIHDTPDYTADLPGVSETGKSVSADSPLQPEHNVADHTDTWSGTEGQTAPVTSAVSKWSVA